MSATPPLRVCVVGSGSAFVSGISYYTYYLARSLTRDCQVSVILMRRLIPRFLYPGRSRVGKKIMNMHPSEFAPTYDGVDWTAVPSIFAAVRFLRRQRPDVLVFQWWTAAVLPWYLLLAFLARRRGARIVFELHEDQDTGEARLPLVPLITRRGLRALVSWSSAFVVHSAWDRERMSTSLGIDIERTFVIPHGPYEMTVETVERGTDVSTRHNETTILYFGTIRPYKGLEYLVEAFNALPREGGQRWRLLVVGETWEGWTKPVDLIRASPYREDIDLVNHYVVDDEVPGFFAQSDIVALPYLRSSASGPLAMTMSHGLPVVVTNVGGLVESASSYTGAVLVEAGDAAALRDGILAAIPLTANRHRDVRSWDDIAEAYGTVFSSICAQSPARFSEVTEDAVLGKLSVSHQGQAQGRAPSV